MKRILLILAFTAPSVPVPAQAEDPVDSTFAFPIVARAEATGFQTGMLLLHYLEPDESRQSDSRLQAIALITEEDQYLLAFNTFLNFDQRRLTIDASTRFWPSNFFGIGPQAELDDEFEASSRALKLKYEYRLPADFWLGPILRTEKTDIDVDDDNLELIADSEDRIVGLGVSLARDRRDDLQYPSSGNLLRLQAIHYSDKLGSDFSFESQSIDYSHYFPLTEDSNIAISAQLKSQHGDIPFWELNSPDGSDLLRGIENGRYRDQSLIGWQLAYRRRLSERFRLVLFTEFAQVAAGVSDFDKDEYINSTGVGLRWRMLPSQSLNLRADISRVDGDSGFIINIGEAF